VERGSLRRDLSEEGHLEPNGKGPLNLTLLQRQEVRGLVVPLGGGDQEARKGKKHML
jgi:hypothetical protein